jgi:hypothetical protein
VYGDQLRVKREFLGVVPVWHYGVEMPYGQVAENGPFYGVRMNTLEGFAKETPVEVVARAMTMAEREAAVERARSREGEHAYNPLNWNCEHFATWCATGVAASWQVVQWLGYLVKAALVISAGALIMSLREA